MYLCFTSQTATGHAPSTRAGLTDATAHVWRSSHRVAQQIAKICHVKNSRRLILRGIRGVSGNCVGRCILEDFYGGALLPTDNEAAIAMGKIPQFTEHQKHIPIRIYHLKECAADKLVELRPIPTRNELADRVTKALAVPCFQRPKDVLIGKVRFSILLHSKSYIRSHKSRGDVWV